MSNIEDESIRNFDTILDDIRTSNANLHDIQPQIDNALENLYKCLQSTANKTFRPYAQHRTHNKPLSNTRPGFNE